MRPAELAGAEIVQKVGDKLPLDLEFADEHGRPVRLSSFFDGQRPVILTLNYYGCPSLCGIQLSGLLDSLKQMDWTAGEKFEIVTVSFDPMETPELAAAKKQSYMEDYARAAAHRGWHFLTGKVESIRALTSSVGFGYRWNESTQQWLHAAALILCTPSGKVSRYMAGVAYDPKTLRLSLVEASEGRIGSIIDDLFLTCYRYDPHSGSYVPFARGMMTVGGALTVVLLSIVLAGFWRQELRRKRAAQLGAAALATSHEGMDVNAAGVKEA
ncbi:MAG: SCO family protein [Phycisphaerae bacterium]